MAEQSDRKVIRLGPRIAKWRELLRVDNPRDPESYSVIEIHCRLADALDMDVARARVEEALRAYMSNADTLIDYGLDAFNRRDLIDAADNLIGASALLLAVELAVLTVTDVRGVEGADGRPITADRPGFAELLRYPASAARGDLLCNRFMNLVLAPIFEVLTEGKDYVTGQNTSGAAPVADNIAKAAPKTEVPVPEAD